MIDAKLLTCDLGMVIVDLDYGDCFDRREVFPFQNALSDGLASIVDGCEMPAGNVPHGIVTLQSYMLASIKERKGCGGGLRTRAEGGYTIGSVMSRSARW